MFKQFKASGSVEDKIAFKNQSSLVEKLKRKSCYNKTKSNFEECNNDPKLLWGKAKDLINFKKPLSPTLIIQDGKIIRGGFEMAQVLNCSYIKKIRNHISKMKPPTADPMENFNKNDSVPPKVSLAHKC